MEHVIYAVAFGINALIMNILGEYLTEVREPLLPFKPWNCWPCASFWLTSISALIIGAVNGDSINIIIAFGTGFINYYYINSKFKVTL